MYNYIIAVTLVPLVAQLVVQLSIHYWRSDYRYFYIHKYHSFAFSPPPPCDRIPSYVCQAQRQCAYFESEPYRAWFFQFVCPGLSPHNFTAHGSDATFHAVATKVMSEKVYSGRSPLVLTLGPNSLEEDAKEFLLFAQWPTRLFFVEANPEVVPLLHKNVESYGFNTSDARKFKLMNHAVCVNGEESATLYTSPDAPTIKEAHTVPDSWLIDPSRKLLNALTVPCITPKGIIDFFGPEPNDIDILLMDLEGLDLDTLDRFLAIDGFSPWIIKFEWHVAHHHAFMKSLWYGLDKIHRDITMLLRKLSSKGYSTHMFGVDMIAIRSDYDHVLPHVY
eukprot:gnl/TRDRNA2_/TRDRNA2_33024_c0_seq1.p1 gnl/TRDRNA2_/TRDRNA2_33024_c0~~gnl/TRDRNA2_/TRDRNA2_33024_c0_seq1.p1  ORF type:complete len:334 (-),score=17.41 gnl/TRDRNA2_/TRDRNA2_33024_c0_seq1:64-1065(-)